MLWLWLLACGPEDDTDDACADAPVVTWESAGEGLVTEYCQPCHASTSQMRNDAPEDVTFDTHEDVIHWKSRILARATGDEPTMPPAVPMAERDRELLRIWLTCWEE